MQFNMGTLMVITSWLALAIMGGVLVISLKKNKFRLLNGILGNMFLIISGITVVLTVMYSQVVWLEYGILILAIIILIPVLITYLSLGFLLLWNAIIVWRKESHTLGNMLTLFLGILVIISPLIFRGIRAILPGPIAETIISSALLIVMYCIFWLLSFITSFLITRLLPPKLDKKYIIVLGAGLLDGKRVSPLLASRIMKAKEFCEQQLKKSSIKPIIIFSGGQGSDEKVPEGIAMKEYAIEHGMQDLELIAEINSKNTYQNMLFSKKIIEAKGLPLDSGIFSTSDYHTFRAAGYARYVGLNIDGIGAKTSKFFIPNAFIREYIAILMQHKLFHLVTLVVLLFANIGLAVLDAIIN